MTDATAAQQHEPKVLWQLGDPWRSFVQEILDSPVPVWAVTGSGTVRVVHFAEGWQMRVPVPGGAAIAGDGTKDHLTEVSVATPCGITTWGRTSDSWSSSIALVLLATGIPHDWQATSDSLRPEDFHATFQGHPPELCGARYCRRGDLPELESEAT